MYLVWDLVYQKYKLCIKYNSRYGKHRTYKEVAGSMLKDVNDKVKANPEKALYLSPEQVESLTSFSFAATGFYGGGKTTALEVAIDKIVENPAQFPHPKIVFVTWDDSLELKQMFEEKFKKIKDQNFPQFTSDSLEVLSLVEVCEKYGVEHMPNPMLFSKDWFLSCVPFFKNRTKPDLLNDLCQKLQGELKDFGNIYKFLYTGTYTFEGKACEKKMAKNEGLSI